METFNPKIQPHWFPLPAYKESLSAHQLIAAVAIRVAVRTQWQNVQNPVKSESVFLSLLGRSSESLAESSESFIGEPPYSMSVREQDAFEAMFLACKQGDSTAEVRRMAEACALNWKENIAEKVEEAPRNRNIPSALAVIDSDEFYEVLGGRVPLSVNLFADDQTLMRDFELWLAFTRRDVPEKQVREKDLKRWKDLSILAAFDLSLWATIHGGKYTAAQMGAMLWPDDAANGAADTTERYRKLCAPKVEEVFVWETVERLIAQVVSERVHGNLVQAHKDAVGIKL